MIFKLKIFLNRLKLEMNENELECFLLPPSRVRGKPSVELKTAAHGVACELAEGAELLFLPLPEHRLVAALKHQPLQNGAGGIQAPFRNHLPPIKAGTRLLAAESHTALGHQKGGVANRTAVAAVGDGKLHVW